MRFNIMFEDKGNLLEYSNLMLNNVGFENKFKLIKIYRSGISKALIQSQSIHTA